MRGHLIWNKSLPKFPQTLSKPKPKVVSPYSLVTTKLDSIKSIHRVVRYDVMQYINQRFAVCYGTDLVSILFFHLFIIFLFYIILLIFELSQSSELYIFLFDQRHGYKELESMVRCTFLFCFVFFRTWAVD